MSESSRRAALEKLQAELAGVEPADEHGRQLLASARADVQRALEQMDVDAASTHEPLVERLQDAVYHFEGTHPDLAVTINSVINTLSNMGL